MQTAIEPPATPEQIEAALDEATLRQLDFKIGQSTNVAVAIVHHMLKDRIVWSDEIQLPVLAAEDKNVVGFAFRRLLKLGIIMQMQEHRRSKHKSRRGGLAFKYRIGNIRLAETFLRRNNATVFRRSVEELDLEPKAV